MRLVMCGWLALCLAACAGNTQLVGGPALQVVSDTALPMPTLADVAPPTDTFVLGPRDLLQLSVVGFSELSLEKIQVDNGGNISLPIAGTIHANGRTPAQLTQDITARLRAGHIRNPQVAVNLIETHSQLFFVDGEVTTPGGYPVIGRMTLTKALTSAQGLTQYANTKYVVVIREVGSQRYAALYNLDSIRSGLAQDPPIFTNDQILVGESRARRFFHDALTVAPVLATPLVVLLQRL